MRALFMLVSPAIIGLFTGTNSYAQDKTSEIDKIFNWASATTPGCVCAVSQNGKLVYNRAYGSADLEREVPINTNMIFDAGSLTKQFVAAAVLLLVEEGRLSLTDDIRKYIPELPDYGHNIKVDNLLTHTSGIRDWTAIKPLAARDEDVWTLILRQRGLDFVPGEEVAYSNSGFVLAKEIVARVSGMSFAEFTRKRLFEALGMKSTKYADDMLEIVKNRALAYDKDGGRWKTAMLLGKERGGGGILSTASDLLIWNDALTNNRLGNFVSEKLQEPAKLNNGRKLGYGRGLFLDTDRGSKVVWHTGSAHGYKSLLARYPEHGLSIAIMCNSGDGTDRMAFAQQIFDLLVPPANGKTDNTNIPPATTDSAGLANLNSKAGLFMSGQPGELLRLIVDRGRLRVANGPILSVVTKDRFKRVGNAVQFMSSDEFELNFLSADEFELRSMEGKITKYRRAQSYTPSPNELNAFAGEYESKEIGSIFHIAPSEGSLRVYLTHASGNVLEFKPIAPDMFQASRIMVRFVRDKSGKVTGLDFSNPLVRNVKFTRLS